jgi:hypothetical protein
VSGIIKINRKSREALLNFKIVNSHLLYLKILFIKGVFILTFCSGEFPLDEAGSKAVPCEFLPDYSVKAHTDITFIKIPMYLYKAALKASKMQEEEGYDLEELGLVISFTLFFIIIIFALNCTPRRFHVLLLKNFCSLSGFQCSHKYERSENVKC